MTRFGIRVPSQVIFSVELMYCPLRVSVHANRVDLPMCYTLNYILLWAGFDFYWLTLQFAVTVVYFECFMSICGAEHTQQNTTKYETHREQFSHYAFGKFSMFPS
jgi:hypothetical protein